MNYTNQLVLTGQIDDVGNRIKTNSGKSYRLGVEIEDTRSLGNKLTLYTNITGSINKNKDFYYVYDGELYNFEAQKDMIDMLQTAANKILISF